MSWIPAGDIDGHRPFGSTIRRLMATPNFQAKMDHLIRLLSTTSGADKSFMLLQYSAIILRQLISRSKHGEANKSQLDTRLAALSKLLSDARTTLSFLIFFYLRAAIFAYLCWCDCANFSLNSYRLWDLISIIQWLRSLNSLPPSGSKPVQIERLQVITMLIYYPLEHLYFLASKGIVPLSARLINRAVLYSCRAWAGYTILHFFHLWEELKLLEPERRRLQALQMASDKASSSPRKSTSSALASSLQEMDERRAALINGLIVNLAYTPLTIHWCAPLSLFNPPSHCLASLILSPFILSLSLYRSLPNGLYNSETITGICGFVAAVAQLRAGWKASAVTR
ncbi:hypothetical protein VP01_1121g4 [Puccinia sorghi]|uniref:Uncharacterized protein n=1 Tax=Puccinia sorghi TaxID=27349 RepID=A0A0L6VTS2_9BASI|nr:hypothetical protein VP01_1121g4 [Puccinia sorghi]